MSHTIDDRAWELLVTDITQIRDSITDVDDKITDGFDRLNGRVRTLEYWRAYLTGAVGVISAAVAIMWGVFRLN